MEYEIKLNTGSVFPNDRKTSEKHPDWRGKIKIDPSIIDKDGFIEISAWDNKSRNGLDYKSLSVQAPYVKQDQPQSDQTQNDNATEDQEIPF